MSEPIPFSNDEFDLSVQPHDTDGFRVQAPGLARALGVRELHRRLGGRRELQHAEVGAA